MREREAVNLWEDTVGDSGEAPTSEELSDFATAVQKQTLQNLSIYFKSEAHVSSHEDPKMPHILQWAGDRVDAYMSSMFGED